MTFDSYVAVDWSGGADRGPRPSADAIWIAAILGGQAQPSLYCRNRVEAEAQLADLIAAERAAGRRVFLGFDFAFALPKGVAERLTGTADPFALWALLDGKINDMKDGRDRIRVAADLNRDLPGEGPFWANPFGQDVAHVARKKPLDFKVREHRATELACPSAKTVWQLAGAGSVGSQFLMGVPVLARLRQRFAGEVAVWPFDAPEAPIVMAEIYPSLLDGAVKTEMAQAAARGEAAIKDEVQVRLFAQCLSRLTADSFEALFEPPHEYSREEGWIFGVGHEALLTASLAVPPLKNDCFALPSGVHWTPVDEALDMLRSRLPCRVGHETCASAFAVGRILAKDVSALRANPPGANSAVDGYGFSGGRDKGVHRLPLAKGRAAAGAPFQGAVRAGQAVRILTGALLPEGVDTVILQEDVALEDGAITFQGPLKAGANCRRAGEDVATGAQLFPKGRQLSVADVALLSATGVAEVPVHRRLRVAVMSTGDELADPAPEAPPSITFDANRPMLLALARQWGCEVVDLGRIPDSASRIEEALHKGARDADVILTSGGASAGDEDHISAALNQAGAMALWRIALKPGRPLCLGVWEGVPVFGLPGNPVAALVCALVFARPALVQMAGGAFAPPQGFTLPAGFSKRKKAGRSEYLRARVRDGAVEVFGSEGSGRISGLSWADGLVALPPEAADIAPGDPVLYIPFGSFGL